MTLDCTTPRGKSFIWRQDMILARCACVWSVDVVATPAERESPIDALLHCDGRLIAVVEVKARDMTLQQLHTYGSYLVTLQKLEQGRDVARLLCVPYLLIVGFWPEQTICWWRISDERGAWRVPMRREQTLTQMTCNGGTAFRMNAYLSLDAMRDLTDVYAMLMEEPA